MGLRGHVSEYGGWSSFEGVAGWEGYNVSIRAKVIDGQPRAFAVKLEPITDERVQGITATRLKSLPLLDLAQTVVDATHTSLSKGLRDSVRRLSKDKGKGKELDKSRAVTTTERVAAEWNAAYEAGKAPRDAVCKALSIANRTADRYIKMARAEGLIIVTPRRHSKGAEEQQAERRTKK